MSNIKLEVGKTYRSRKGERVEILDFEKGGFWTYYGSNGKMYAESCRCNILDAEHPDDLIEEVGNTRHTFAIPDGVKKLTVEQVGNRIVVEMVPEKEPKPGDVMINEKGSVYIFKSVVDENLHRLYAWWGKIGRLAKTANLATCGMCLPGRPATPEEAQPLWDALKKAGKRWNPETMQVEEIPEFDRIREWVEMHLEDGHYNQEGIAEVIGHYLKHKEETK